MSYTTGDTEGLGARIQIPGPGARIQNPDPDPGARIQDPGLRARIAKRTVEEGVKISVEKLRRHLPPDWPAVDPTKPAPRFGKLTPERLSGGSDSDSDCKPGPLKLRVGIVGGGMGGLYTAMILNDLGIPYEVLERSDDCGGRVWTHYFSDPEVQGDYYDVGAMRFPDIPIMRRTFRLFEQLGIGRDPAPNPAQETLIPYYMSGPQNPLYYNNIGPVVGGPVAGVDTFEVGVANGGLVPDAFVTRGYKDILREIFDEWKLAFATNFENTWQALMKLDEKGVTVRSYMIRRYTMGPVFTPRDIQHVVNWCETMDAATNHYDCSFTALLLHALEFDWPLLPAGNDDPIGPGLGPEAPANGVWWCLNGGARVLTRRMRARVGDNILPTTA